MYDDFGFNLESDSRIIEKRNLGVISFDLERISPILCYKDHAFIIKKFLSLISRLMTKSSSKPPSSGGDDKYNMTRS